MEDSISLPKEASKIQKNSEALTESISETLHRLRVLKGLTPGQLAKLSGINPLTINLYENPYYEHYEIKTLQKLVESCGGKLNLSISFEG